jgi:hypothetical protein
MLLDLSDSGFENGRRVELCFKESDGVERSLVSFGAFIIDTQPRIVLFFVQFSVQGVSLVGLNKRHFVIPTCTREQSSEYVVEHDHDIL